jgi:hypothetical protein
MIDQRKGFNSWEVGIKDAEGSKGSGWGGVMQSGDRMGNGAWK